MRSLAAIAFALALAAPLAGPRVHAADRPPPSPATPLPAGLPPGERFVLDNGLTVLLVPSHGNPYLDIQLGFRAGGGLDPAGKEGLASLLGRMLSAGIPEADEAALAAELARLGGWIAPDVGMESFVLGGQIPTLSDADVRRFLDLFARMALTPTIPTNLLEREKTLRLGLLRRVADNPEALAHLAAKLAAFGPGAFGWSGYGSPRSIPSITRDDVADLHAALFAPAHGVLVVGGAFDPPAMRAWIERRFGATSGFGRGQSSEDGAVPGRKARLCAERAERLACFDNPLAAPPPERPAAPRTIHVVVDDAGLSQIPWRLVAPNPIAMLDPSWPAFRLGTYALGGDFTSALNSVLRTQEGLTYGAYFEPAFGGHYSGAMMVSTDATPDALARSLALAKAELSALATAPLADVALDRFRAMLVNSFAFKFETLPHTVEQYLILELASVPLTFLATWRDLLARPSPAEVRAAMSRLDPAAMTLVVAGPAALAETLAAIGHGPVVTVAARDLLTLGLP